MKTAEAFSDPLVAQLVRRRGISPEEAVELYAEQRRLEARQTSLPIDVNLVASVAGIRRRVVPVDFAGRIYADESGQLVMDLRADDSEPRRRFTCAHEIIHTAFPGFREEARYRIDQSVGNHRSLRSEEEYLCDRGAALLLMPTALVAKNYRLEQGLDAVERLAKAAEVSLEAAGSRLASLATVPAAFIVLEVRNKPADRYARREGSIPEPKLRVRYAAMSSGLNLFVPPFKGVDDDSVYARALTTRNFVRGTGSLPGDTRYSRSMNVEAKSYPRTEDGRGVDRVLAVAIG